MVARICEKLVKYHETKIMFSAIPVIGCKKLYNKADSHRDNFEVIFAFTLILIVQHRCM